MLRRKRPLTLRGILTAVVFATTAGAVGAVSAIVVLTAALHQIAGELSDSLESVRIAEELEIGLLTHDRTRDPVAHRLVEAQMRRDLGHARLHVGSAHEARVLEDAVDAVEAHIQSNDLEGERGVETTFTALEKLVDVNVDDANLARERADHWEHLASAAGVAIAVALALVTTAFVVWVRGHAFRTLFGTQFAIERYMRGDRATRAPEEGPEEIRSIARRFNEMAATLERQHRQQLEFVAGVAHDLRTPMTTVKVSLAAFPANLPLPPEDRVRRTLRVVDTQVDRLESMLGDFLDAARIEAGALSLDRAPVSLSSLARRTVELFADGSPDHRILLEDDSREAAVFADPRRLEQTLANLVSNAVKYSPGGGEVRVRLEATDDTVTVSVQDHGIGITPEEQELVFEPFRRSKQVRDAIPGTGLGLSVARRIVEAHGGSIRVRSAAGAGSTFEIVLPRFGAASGARPTAH